jgi:hypothetical protein
VLKNLNFSRTALSSLLAVYKQVVKSSILLVRGSNYRCPNGWAVPARPGLASGSCRAGPQAPIEAQERPARLIIGLNGTITVYDV